MVPDTDTSQAGPLIATGKPPDYEDIEVVKNEVCKPGKVGSVIDVGGCVGSWTLAFASLPVTTLVYTFEPQNILWKCICGSLRMNGISNASCHNLAVGDLNGRIAVPQFDIQRPTSFGSIEFGAQQTENLGHPRLADSDETVEITRLDSFQIQSSPIIFIKIDAEGMESEVLRGASDIIRRDRPIMFVEFIKSDKDALRRQIEVMGYSIEDRYSDFLCRPSTK